MKAILLCGYRNENDGLGKTLLDRRIQQLRTLGFEVICVLSGPGADAQLRHCPTLSSAELVFDCADQPSLASNLKAGLAATDGEGCFTIPLEVPLPPEEAWEFLRETWRNEGFHTQTNVFQAVNTEGAPWQFGFPLLITRSGNALIQELEGFHDLVDTRLKYSHLTVRDHADLASVRIAL